MRTFALLGKDGMKDKDGLTAFEKEEIIPRLNALKPSTPEEEKIKAAAAFLKSLVDSVVDPTTFKAEELAVMDTFIAGALPKDEVVPPGDRLGWVFIRYQEYISGVTLEQLKKLKNK
jgi:hypothetical protein